MAWPPVIADGRVAAIGLMFFATLFAAPAILASAPGAPVDHHIAVADHHISASGSLDHLAGVSHDHIGTAPTQGLPDSWAEAVSPRIRTVLPALGLILAAAVLWTLSLKYRTPVGRGPPRAPLTVSPGRDVLARLCISRR